MTVLISSVRKCIFPSWWMSQSVDGLQTTWVDHCSTMPRAKVPSKHGVWHGHVLYCSPYLFSLGLYIITQNNSLGISY